MDLGLVLDLFIALGTGALIGFEREHSEEAGVFAGSRTLPLIALFGALLQAFVPSFRLVGFAFLLLMVALAYVGKVYLQGDAGLTTVIASVVTFVLGILATHPAAGPTYTVVFGAMMVALLSMKRQLHGLARRIDPTEREAMVTFLVLALVILPILPDESLDALFGLNPRFVWLMVVFISGIELAAYLLMRWWHAKGGLAVTGFLGGLISSTATTVSMAQRSKDTPSLAVVCALAAAGASVVMLPRVLLEVAVVNPGLLWTLSLPIGAMLAAGVGALVVLYARSGSSEEIEPEVSNPFHLRGALGFAALFALILVAVERAEQWFGATGIYATAVLSGLADVDAITLSMSRFALEGHVTDALASTAIVLAIVSNTVVKMGIAWLLGTRKLGLWTTLALASVAVVGLATLGFL